MSELLFNNYETDGELASDIASLTPGYYEDMDDNKTDDLAPDLNHLPDFPHDAFGNNSSMVENHQMKETSCQYCGIDSTDCLIKCNTCKKWFCNGKSVGGSSHIVTHLILSRHNSVALHEDSHLGDTTLECYSCGKQNSFNLGYISAKQDQVVVILCRIPCSQMKDLNWDSNNWKPLIEERQFLSWIASVPTEDETINSQLITQQQILKLESEWRLNRNTNINDLNNLDNSELKKNGIDGEISEVLPTLMRYIDGYQYQKSFGPLIKLESDYDKELKESQALEHIQVKWSMGLNNRHLASFTLSTYETTQLKVAVGDEIFLRYNELNEPNWEGKGFIIKLPNSYQEYFTLELIPNKITPPTTKTSGFTAEFVWKGISYERMQESLKTFAIDEKSVSSYIYHKILGHDVKPIEFDINLPKKLSIPSLAELNDSQLNAVKTVLKRPLSLIQGPPGTGKTVTSATIIYHLNKLNKGQKILVCAPSNIAVDHLAEKLDSIGLNTARIFAKSREDVDNSIEHLSLHYKVEKFAKGPLKKLIKLKNEIGELSEEDSKLYYKLLRERESSMLDKTDIICCTCVGAGDKRLKKYNFRIVLIDESTQAAEPEILIPIVKGSKQVILVGDHQQLGPVILHKEAGDSGLKQSLFERLIILGHVPIRLEVQYRMNPHLSEFPSNMFYEGSLQDGVTVEQRLLENTTFPWPIANIPMFFWGNYGKEEISSSGVSFLNRVEAMNVEKIVTRLFKDGVQADQIGVITPYEGQRAFITQYMSLNGTLFDKKDDYLQIEVTSVDAFQGREKDFIILSCVRANDQQNIGFLRDPRRLNVALTRAKYGLIILGNSRALSKNFLWNHLLLHFREKGCLVDGPLENLKLSVVQLSKNVNELNTNSNILNSTLNANFGGNTNAAVSSNFNRFKNEQFQSEVSSLKSFNTNELSSEKWPELNKNINSNFYSKLSKLDQEFTKNNTKINEDDIKSITSSFADGFNLN